MIQTKHIVVGCGGIGQWVIRGLAPTLGPQDELLLVDGDSFEPKNLRRQGASFGGKTAHYQQAVSQLRIGQVNAIAAYVGDGDGMYPVRRLINEGDTVWLCVDNHATRKAVIERCSELADVLLLSGGNEEVDGNVSVYYHAAGIERTPSPFKRHPELAAEVKFVPPTPVQHEASCQALADAGDGQTIVANMMAAVCMLSAHQQIVMRSGDQRCVSEVYFSCLPQLGLRQIAAA